MTLIPGTTLDIMRLYPMVHVAPLVSAVSGLILAAYLISKSPLTYWWTLITLPYLFWSISFVLIIACIILIDSARHRGILHTGILPFRLIFLVGFAPLGVGIYLYLKLRMSLKKHEELEDEVYTCNELLESNPDTPEIYFKRAYAYLQLEQVESCMQDLATMMSLNPNHPLSYYYRCCRNLQLGRKEAANDEFNKLEKTAGSEYAPLVATVRGLMRESKTISVLET